MCGHRTIAGLCTVVGLLAWPVGPRVARACSCISGFLRIDVLPRPGATGIHRRAAVHFVVTGHSALATEDRLKRRYELWQESPRQRVAIRHVRVGNLVRLVPRRPLAPRKWHHVMAPMAYGNAGVVLTRFRTHRASRLPAMLRTKLGPAGLLARPSSGHRPGRCYASPSVHLRVPSLGVGLLSRLVFRWEVEHRVGARWVALQASSLTAPRVPPHLTSRYHRCLRRGRRRPCRLPVPRILSVRSIRLGSSQCNRGPTLPQGRQTLRLVLVRADGKRVQGQAQTVLVPR